MAWLPLTSWKIAVNNQEQAKAEKYKHEYFEIFDDVVVALKPGENIQSSPDVASRINDLFRV
eukprot:CAMPEP_0196666146 /NCGR_PEP_ID=MMETSP1086-20130531/64018_1 /TAXON_ID=77921 /ORGANISM="Cyanoptyche  gloeocystis , Strain SAG4.97" /LENGTH=61 /DNA_ID=CAMNT_0042003247 /DNA_START=298 /DNA_END=483 /DNA_ORIENTATION=+